MLTRKTLILIIATLFIGCGAPSETNTTSTTTTASEKVETNQVLTLSQEKILLAINQARAEVRDCHDGLGLVGPVSALSWNDELYASAYEHSSDLAESNTFSHEGSGTASDVTGANNGRKSLFNERIEAHGYVDFYAIGENIAGGQESIEEVMVAWLNSPAHCTNIMSDNYSEVGVAIVVNPESDYEIYWTQNFGRKK